MAARALRAFSALAVASLAVASVAGALGCASGEEATILEDAGRGDTTGFDATLPDGARPDTIGVDTKVGDGAHDTISLFDTELTCDDAGVVNTCDLVTDLGSVALGATRSVDGNVPLKGGDVWYKVKFESLDDTKARPHISITGPTGSFGFKFEVTKSCSHEALQCGDAEDASTTSLTTYEGAYDDAATPENPDAFIPMSVGDAGTVYLRIFRFGTTPTRCDGFSLTLSN